MLSKLLLTILLSSQILLPSVQDGNVLGTTSQEAGDKIVIEGPERIINKNLGVQISATTGVVIDVESGKILFSKNLHATRAIASITKLMSALVFLDTNPDLSQIIEITSEDLTGIGQANFAVGEKIKLENLLYLSLIASDNDATFAIVRATGMTEDEFINKMNIKAKGMGLSNTQFADPVGLNKNNISTAYELAQILRLCSRHSLIRKIISFKNYSFTSESNKYHAVESTNKLLGSYLNVLGGKTGYIDEAGYCFASLIKLGNDAEIISVILNAPGANDRFNDTKRVVNWVETNYQW